MRRTALLLLLASWTAAGCVNTTPVWDSQFGQSVRTAVADQTLHPEGASNRDPAVGIDGKAALGAQKRYENSFAQPESRSASMFTDAVGK